MIDPEEKEAVAAVGVLPPQSSEEDLSSVHEHLRPAAKEHGLALFQLTYSTGVAQHAFEIAMRGARQLRNQELANAVMTAAQMFNAVGQQVLDAKGWTAADTAACDASIRRCMDTKIIVPRSGRIILDS